MNYADTQKQLDMQKWAMSVERDEDMCGKMPYCTYCHIEAEYPCAKAYEKMDNANKPVTAKKAPAKKAAPKKK